MRYPRIILPKQKYKKISVNNLPKDVVIVRRSLCGWEGYFDEDEHISSEALTGSKALGILKGYSTNVLGSYFTLDHLKFRPKECRKPYWNFDHQTVPKKIRSVVADYSIPIFFLIHELHGREIPVGRAFEDKVPYQRQRVQRTQTIVFTCRVRHKPTLYNFWHFEIDYSFKDTKNARLYELAWKKKLAVLAEADLKEIARPEMQYPKIPVTCYLAIYG